MPILPSLPERMNSRPATLCGETRRCVPTCTTLPRCAGGIDHRPAFADRVADRLLDVDVGAGLHGGDRVQRVPVVGRGDDADLGLFPVEQFAIVAVVLGAFAGELLDLGAGGVEQALVDIAQGDDVALPG